MLSIDNTEVISKESTSYVDSGKKTEIVFLMAKVQKMDNTKDNNPEKKQLIISKMQKTNETHSSVTSPKKRKNSGTHSECSRDFKILKKSFEKIKKMLH